MLLPNHFERSLNHLLSSQAVVLVKLFSNIGGLAEFTVNAQGPHPMSNPGLRESVRNLRAHATNHLVIFNRNHAAEAALDSRSYRFDIDPIDERVVDHGCRHALLAQFFSSLERLNQKRTAADQEDISASLQNLGFAPLVCRVLDPGDRIIFPSDEENVTFAIFTPRAISSESFDRLIEQRLRLIGARRGNHHGVRY